MSEREEGRKKKRADRKVNGREDNKGTLDWEEGGGGGRSI
jgi:hypothetical protein